MSKQYIIPPTLEQRTHLRKTLKAFVQTQHLCPPVSLKQLEQLADAFCSGHEECVDMRPWLMVEIHNQVWLPIVAGIPHERRLLMLPKCLSRYGQCLAEYDQYGLLCHRCGRCHIPNLQDRAEQLGGLSIVAEGFTQVIELIENRVVDAVIGVSCLDSLEKAFPLLVRHAVPGLAIALNDSGCRDTHVDTDYVEEMLSQLSDEVTPTFLDHDAIHQQVSRWFTRPELEQLMQPASDPTQQICLDWMSGEGKRWRPFLLSAVWQALTGKTTMPTDVHRAAVAVECFHKASLIHDDVEDSDRTRYGQPTINALYGDAFAINVGDALLGQGYRILAQSNNAELQRLIADAHVWARRRTHVEQHPRHHGLCDGHLPPQDSARLRSVAHAWTELHRQLHPPPSHTPDLFRRTRHCLPIERRPRRLCAGQETTLNPQLSTLNSQLSIVNCHLSTPHRRAGIADRAPHMER